MIDRFLLIIFVIDLIISDIDRNKLPAYNTEGVWWDWLCS